MPTHSFNVDKTVADYRAIHVKLEAIPPPTQTERATLEVKAQRLRAAWMKWNGHEELHEMAFAMPLGRAASTTNESEKPPNRELDGSRLLARCEAAEVRASEAEHQVRDLRHQVLDLMDQAERLQRKIEALHGERARPGP